MDYPERVFVMWILLFSTMLLLFYKDLTFVFQVHRILHSFIKKQALQQQCFIFSLSCSCPWRNSIDKKAFIFGTHIAGVWTAHSIVLKQRHYKDECRNSKARWFFSSFLIEVLGCLHTSKYLIFFIFKNTWVFKLVQLGCTWLFYSWNKYSAALSLLLGVKEEVGFQCTWFKWE